MRPYYSDDFVTIYCGDCREVLPSLDPVETCITDPPYGFAFMGVEWDHAVPDEAYWSLVREATLPGGTLLAFGGTRLWHWLAVGIEEAGWEIRDTLMFLHGQGFPKAHNFGCRCGGKPLPYSHDYATQETAEPQAEHRVRQVRGADLQATEHAVEERGQVLFASLPEPGSSAESAAGAEPKAPGGEQSGVERRQLCGAGEGIPDDPGAAAPPGESERVRAGAHPRSGEGTRASAAARGGGPPHRRGQAEQRPVEPPSVLVPSRALGDGASERDHRCPECGGLLAFKGWSSALKPAWEPIIFAMNPLDGTFASNAQEHGVAGLNVDGARIPAPDGGPQFEHKGQRHKNAYGDGLHGSRFTGDVDTTTGRWPANLALDEDAARLLDEQSGPLQSGMMRGGTRRAAQDAPGSVCYGTYGGDATKGDTYADHGGASRFFYTAKASRSDRGANNDHPTVKPSDLMKWLCTLTSTPTGGTVLDPFMGSGTTIYAAKEMGRKAIGIELSEKYCEVAANRCAQGVLPFGQTPTAGENGGRRDPV